MYVTYLLGKHVRMCANPMFICVSGNLKRAEQQSLKWIKENYNIDMEFDEMSADLDFWGYKNVTNNQDISLCIQYVKDTPDDSPL